MHIRTITTTSIVVMLGLFAQVFCAFIAGEALAAIIVTETNANRSSITNSISVSAGETTVQTNEQTSVVNGTATIKAETMVNGKVVPESVVDIQITESKQVTDEAGEPLIERTNVTTEKTDGLTNQQSGESVFAAAWQAIVHFFARMFS